MKNHNILIFGISAAIVASASYALIAPTSDEADIIEAIDVPALEETNQLKASITKKSTPPLKEAPFHSKYYTIQNGDSLARIFTKFNLSESTLYDITHANKFGVEFARITPGKMLEFKNDKSGNLEQLIYPRNETETLVATRSNQGFSVELMRKEIMTGISSAQAVIDSSLYIDGKEAGLSDKLIMKLADIFAWDIDFALNLRSGDQFTVLYETVYLDGKEITTGNIIVAEFINKGNKFTAVRFEDKKGNSNYYTPDGKSMRKAFLRTPVDFARISSHFNLKRKHPVLNRIRAHKGVDYAAKTGTAVKTTGKGKITYRGHKGGYGRVVIVQHGQRYSTLYAHLSKYKYGLKVGSSIEQGQIIGYVGMSGLATGPHLHYEFRVNGAHRNPLTIKLPHDQPIKKVLMSEFKSQTEPLLTQLEQAKKTVLAKTGT
jgi:murein DD-endopeptidase MepM/ murein hydrolase activator NlpD